LCSHSVASATDVGSRRLIRDFMCAQLREASLAPVFDTYGIYILFRAHDHNTFA
jgi:hypothetical protein